MPKPFGVARGGTRTPLQFAIDHLSVLFLRSRVSDYVCVAVCLVARYPHFEMRRRQGQRAR
jgi:hypothetical protein